jgi:D-3-phosphoglycerate dehydrogenase
MKPIVLLLGEIHEDAMALLREKAEIRFATSLEEEDLIAQVGDVEGIVVRAEGDVNRRVLENAPRLKVVGRHGVGVDNIDLGAASERGIYVVNTPQAPVEPVAEHALGLILILSKRILRSDEAFRQGRWDARFEYIGRSLRGKTLGIVGFGNIGKRLAELCQPFYMTILYHDILEQEEEAGRLRARWVELDELLRWADYVSLHTPLLPATYHLIGERELSLMKPTAYLINTARGAVVDEAALLTALREGKIAGAGLDVFEQEPTPADNPLFALPNVVVTPHMASHTNEALRNMAMVVEDVIAVLEGREPENWVNRNLIEQWEERNDPSVCPGQPKRRGGEDHHRR